MPGRLAFFLLALFLPVQATYAAARPVVFVTIPPQRWLVRQLAGDAVEVVLLVPPGSDPHTFEPTGQQVTRLTRSQGWLTIGMPFEQALLEKARGVPPGLTEFPLYRGVPRLAGGAQAHGHGNGHVDETHESARDSGAARDLAGTDPHIWLTPHGMAQLATNTCRALEQVHPARREELARGLERLSADLAALQVEIGESLLAVRGRTFWTHHASWSYFAEAFGLVQRAVEQDGREPTPRQLAVLVRDARDTRARVLFADPQVDPRPVRVLAGQIGAEVVFLDPLAEDWDHNMRQVAAAILAALKD